MFNDDDKRVIRDGAGTSKSAEVFVTSYTFDVAAMRREIDRALVRAALPNVDAVTMEQIEREMDEAEKRLVAAGESEEDGVRSYVGINGDTGQQDHYSDDMLVMSEHACGCRRYPSVPVYDWNCGKGDACALVLRAIARVPDRPPTLFHGATIPACQHTASELAHELFVDRHLTAIQLRAEFWGIFAGPLTDKIVRAADIARARDEFGDRAEIEAMAGRIVGRRQT